ncbi:hypothetical protein NHX12_021113 [Muraenolepis orangiensis]|uniref:Uncharacterized protein n=1 Tax=Muraenolepis orangiensis TaxID=630683 RepID=A0A9Q0IS00_9TELE|nr:hypothetical protein NHX12_021113 [Muraenolepis orangiensis]
MTDVDSFMASRRSGRRNAVFLGDFTTANQGGGSSTSAPAATPELSHDLAQLRVNTSGVSEVHSEPCTTLLHLPFVKLDFGVFYGAGA